MIQIEDIRYTSKHVLTGLLVSLIGIWVPLLFLIIMPNILGVVAWVAFLVVYLLFFSGKLGWSSTAVIRAHRFRLDQTNSQLLGIGMILSLLLALFWHSMLMVTFRLIEFPYDLFIANTNYEGLQSWQVWLMIFFGAISAGVYEEIGFRGYMQVPLENRYGLFRAIILTSIFFTVLHLNQLYAPSVLLPLFLFACSAGILAFVTDSLLPVIMSHILLDVFNFGYWWSDFFGRFDHQTIFTGGTDAHFWFWSGTLVISAVAFLYLARITLLIKKKTTTFRNASDSEKSQLSNLSTAT